MRNLVLLLSIISLTSCQYTVYNEMEDMNIYNTVDTISLSCDGCNIGTDTSTIGEGEVTTEGIGVEGNPIDYTFNAPDGFTDGLIAYYPFTGGVTDDFSGNNFHGKGYNVEAVEDRFGNESSALYFSNADTINDSFVEALDIDTSVIEDGFSITLWVKKDGTGYSTPRPIDIKSDRTDNKGNFSMEYPLTTSYIYLKYRHESNGGFAQTLSHTNGQYWDLLTFTVSKGGYYRLYRNGNLEQDIWQGQRAELPLGQLLTIGKEGGNGDGHAFRGYIDDVSIHSRVLAASEIKAIYDLTE